MVKSPLITSRRHAIVHEIREIRDNRENSWMFLEGPRLVQEAVQSGLPLEILAWTPSSSFDSWMDAAQASCRRAIPMDDSVFEAVSDVKSPQGILAIARRPLWGWQDLLSRAPAPFLILDGLQDPGNLATIVRTAEAAGAAGLISTSGTTGFFSPKALRGAMGSSLRLPCLEQHNPTEIQQELKKAGYCLYAASMESKAKPSILYTKADWKQSVAILLGREGSGFSSEWTPFVDTWLHIPMKPPVESLNVASAAAILLYESSRNK